MSEAIDPFGLALRGANSSTFTPMYTPLPAGVNTILVTSPGTRALILILFSGSTWDSQIETWTIPAGTKTWIHTIGVRDDETPTISLAAATGVSLGLRATIQITTIPLYGAGGGKPLQLYLIWVVLS